MTLPAGTVVLKDSRGLVMLAAGLVDRSPVPEEEPAAIDRHRIGDDDVRPRAGFETRGAGLSAQRWAFSRTRSFGF